jgi:hypothetical protein
MLGPPEPMLLDTYVIQNIGRAWDACDTPAALAAGCGPLGMTEAITGSSAPMP